MHSQHLMKNLPLKAVLSPDAACKRDAQGRSIKSRVILDMDDVHGINPCHCINLPELRHLPIPFVDESAGPNDGTQTALTYKFRVFSGKAW
jgi:hypothetical protein